MRASSSTTRILSVRAAACVMVLRNPICNSDDFEGRLTRFLVLAGAFHSVTNVARSGSASQVRGARRAGCAVECGMKKFPALLAAAVCAGACAQPAQRVADLRRV